MNVKRDIAGSPFVPGVRPGQPWYVPDRRLRTRVAEQDALAIVDWITGGRDEALEPDEQELFAALHACAYRAVQRSRGKSFPESTRARWTRRWKVIREYLVERNLGLVYSMIGRFGSKQLDEQDLLSDAMLGLTRAVDRFNPWKGYRFSTYACNVIARALMRRGKRERRHRELFPVYFDSSLEPPTSSPDTETDLYVERLHRVMDRNLGALTDLESRILSQRFPCSRGQRLTFQQIGEMVGLSKERVRQIQNVALGKLRQVLSEDPVLK